MQPIPEEYEPLGFVGFTDRGDWSSEEIYIKNDLVHEGNIVWLCLNSTTGSKPQKDDPNWKIFVKGEPPVFDSYDNFPNPPSKEDKKRFYVDIDTDPRLMYTWSDEKSTYVLTGGAGGADGGSVDIPITLTFADWTGTTAPYQQTITLPQMREGMTPLYFLASDGDDAQYAFGLIIDYQVGYAEITFYAADTPAVDLNLTLKGIPAQKLEYVDNTVVFLVEPSAFALNDTTQRYEATIPVEGMTAGTGGTWDIVRSGPVLTEVESNIALHITDVDRLDGAVKISCLEVPEQRYMMSLAGTYIGAEDGTIILANMQEWFDRVDALEEVIHMVEEAVVSAKASGKVTYQKLGHIVCGCGTLNIEQDISSYESIVTGIPVVYGTSAYMGVFITDDNGYNSMYVDVNAIKTRKEIKTGSTIRLLFFYMCE